MIRKEQQDEREYEHPEDFGRDADVVQDAKEPNTERIDQRRQDERHQRDEGEHRRQPARVRGVKEARTVRHRPVDAIDHEGDDHGDGGDGHDLRPEVEPAGEPSERPVGQALGPLIDGASHREVARQFGEDQGDEQLAADDDGPRPEERRTSEADSDAEVPEGTRRNADEAEGDGEVAQEPEGSAQLRLDAEGPQMRVVARGLLGIACTWTRHNSLLNHHG